jgi:hypothetical protein
MIDKMNDEKAILLINNLMGRIEQNPKTVNRLGEQVGRLGKVSSTETLALRYLINRVKRVKKIK